MGWRDDGMMGWKMARRLESLHMKKELWTALCIKMLLSTYLTTSVWVCEDVVYHLKIALGMEMRWFRGWSGIGLVGWPNGSWFHQFHRFEWSYMQLFIWWSWLSWMEMRDVELNNFQMFESFDKWLINVELKQKETVVGSGELDKARVLGEFFVGMVSLDEMDQNLGLRGRTCRTLEPDSTRPCLKCLSNFMQFQHVWFVWSIFWAFSRNCYVPSPSCGREFQWEIPSSRIAPPIFQCSIALSVSYWWVHPSYVGG